ncbi:MAG TPA: tetratricopeptide repeat protein [Candidatus Acidoferrum sp.]|nr:tetratricopeptide repeat protein [Candidatus Acidoferrum sp.]
MKSAAPEIPQVNIAGLPRETQDQVAKAYAAARKQPQDADAVGKLGMLLDSYHVSQDAALCYRRAHLLAPAAFKWLYYWGSLLLRENKMGEALPVLTSALQLEPEYLPAKLKAGEALLGVGKTDEAGKRYEGILKDYPETAEAYYGLGRVKAALGDQAAAAELFRQACQLFPTYGAAHYGLAVAYRKLGRIQEAEEQASLHERNNYIVPPLADPLRDELRALDMSAATHLERGVQLEQVGRTDDAVAETEKALELDPSLAKAHLNLLILYAKEGMGKQAEEHYKALVALDPNQFPDAYYNYGVLLVEEGKFDEAEKNFRKALAIAPSNDAAHNNLGYLLERQGKLEEAAIEYKKAIEANPSSRKAHFKLGRILVNQQHYAEAIEQLQQTLTPVDEDTPSYMYALGAAYGRAGDHAQALHYLEQARELAVLHGQNALASEIEKDLEQVKSLSKSSQLWREGDAGRVAPG